MMNQTVDGLEDEHGTEDRNGRRNSSPAVPLYVLVRIRDEVEHRDEEGRGAQQHHRNINISGIGRLMVTTATSLVLLGHLTRALRLSQQKPLGRPARWLVAGSPRVLSNGDVGEMTCS